MVKKQVLIDSLKLALEQMQWIVRTVEAGLDPTEATGFKNGFWQALEQIKAVVKELDD